MRSSLPVFLLLVIIKLLTGQNLTNYHTENVFIDPCERTLNKSSLDFKKTFENLVHTSENLTKFFEFADFINTKQSPSIAELLENLEINPNQSIYSIEVHDDRKLRNIAIDYIFEELDHRRVYNIVFIKARSEPLSLPGIWFLFYN